MAYNCPHCQQGIDDVVPADTVKSRVDAKNQEIALLKGELKTAKDTASSAETFKRERDAATAELLDLRESSSRATALRRLGIDTSTEEGLKLEKTFLALHRSENAGLDDGERTSFGDWLESEEGARTNPLLDRYFSSSENQVEGPPASEVNGRTTTGNRTGRFPKDRSVGDPPPERRGKMSPGELRLFLQKMTPAQVRGWMERHGEDYGMAAPPTTPGKVQDQKGA